MSVFLKAIEVLNAQGWRKKGYFNSQGGQRDIRGPCCVVGACTLAAGLTEPSDFERTHEYHRLADVSGDIFPHRFNDAATTKYDDVINLLRKAHEYECSVNSQNESQAST